MSRMLVVNGDGPARAVAQVGTWKLGGLVAWLLWGGVHIAFLIGFRNRCSVLLSWFWNCPRNARDARLITGEARLDIRVPRPPDFVPDNPPAAAEPRAPVVGDEPLARRGFNRLGPPSSWGRRTTAARRRGL